MEGVIDAMPIFTRWKGNVSYESSEWMSWMERAVVCSNDGTAFIRGLSPNKVRVMGMFG